MQNTKNKTLYHIIIVGLMAALVYVGNYMQIKIPNGTVVTRIHLGNSMCLLAGLLFGPVTGGLSSGIGAALYDLFDPVYITSAPYTFLSKFAMGFVAGLIAKRGGKTNVTIGAVAGQITYIVLYLGKTFVKQLMLGNAMATALTTTGTNALTSTINGILACIISIPLALELAKALSGTQFSQMISLKHQKAEVQA